MNDGLPLLEDFVTWDGRCALCAHLSIFSCWCYLHGKVVAKDDTCDSFKEKSLSRKGPKSKELEKEK